MISNFILPVSGVIVLLLLALSLVNACFVSASPGQIKVISGPRGQRVLHGKTGWKIPILERVDVMTASMISIDAKTTDYVPTNDYINVKVDAAVKVRIATDDKEKFQAATRNFLYKNPETIAEEVRDTIEGHLRAIIGQMKLRQIVTDRTSFSDKVQENAKQDLAEMGLEIVAFNIQGLADENGVIQNLGIDNTEQIRKDAAIAKANARKEVAQAEAEAEKIANDARVEAELQITQKNTDLEKKKAAFQVEADTEKAKADAAYKIQQQIQRKDIERETMQAEITKQEQAINLKEKEVQVRKQTLDAEVKAEADAQRYAQEQASEAELFARQKNAEAEAYEKRRSAEANRDAMLKEAEGIKAKGEAEALAIELKLKAEAEGLNKKAEAMAKMRQAAILEMYFDALPKVAESIAAPLSNIDKITMYGEGNTSKLVEDITKSVAQISAGLGDSVGINMKDILGKVVKPNASDLTDYDDFRELPEEPIDEDYEIDEDADTTDIPEDENVED